MLAVRARVTVTYPGSQDTDNMSALQLTNHDFHLKENKEAHNCGAYIGDDLVVRRGQDFRITLTFSGPVNEQDRLQFTVSLVTSSGAGKSLLEYSFSDSSRASDNSWSAQRSGNGSATITVNIHTPNDAPIGRYLLHVGTNGGTKRVGEFMLIFNCWAPGDSVYLSDPAERNEYVLEEFGIICVGEVSNKIPIPWNYGQFQKNVLYTTFLLLDSTLSFRRNQQEDVRRRNDPSHICRVLSAIINSKDDNGVVMGNWSGDYSGGRNPSSWNGSLDILKAWNEQRQPVKYGQCWVFAGVLCTVSRALGIPSRVITNYSSAHDTNGNLRIEEYYDANGEPVTESDDSIWNFHCWNEAWLVRTGLDKSFNGWQIYDSTPQEMSDGIFQLGPTSQHAVKEGDVNTPYDTRFVYSEVNADVVKVIVQKDGKKTIGETNHTNVGLFICTKAVGNDSYINITREYKYPEGSSEERQTYNKALRLIGLGSGFVPFSADGNSASASRREAEVSGEISVSGLPKVGDDIEAILTLKNLSPKNRNVTVNISAAAIVYNKSVRRKLFNHSVTVNLSPNEEKEIPIKIAYSQYEKVLTIDNTINVTAVCRVEDWGDLVVENYIVLTKPPLITKALGPAVLGKPMTVEVTFTNPLATHVKNCVLTAEGSGLTKDEVKKSFDVVEPDQTMKITLNIEPYVSGQKKLLVNFTCDRFIDVKGFLTIDVTEK
ncbi:protein-glutamine gamma-glutamyltransferase E-like isoform X3 [Bufo gargarizans]|uniref:protein-glutamine gamma-glutamyltransferase E-like isoform X3 n=1 Tax=Bufo gargarizans TaxID=30331 RepID=UPI001CF5E8DF|nr:protein-glutamine gamma-glutamyltransferase E-like isoform X3 [Bufo gargarizans]